MQFVKYFLEYIQISLLSIVLLLPSFSYADEVAISQQIPAGAVQVTPEEFKELKKEEVKNAAGTSVAPSSNPSWFYGGGEVSILIIAVVGTVILIAWVPYTVFLAYERLKKPESFKDYSLLNFQFNSFINIDEYNVSGEMNSLKYTFLTQRLSENNNSSVKKNKKLGLNIEIGHYSFRYLDKTNNTRTPYNSAYWLIGPSVIFGSLREKMSSTFLKFDLQAGTSFKRDVKLILKFDITLNHKFKNEFFIGGGFGDTFLNGKAGKGIASHLSDLSVHWLLSAGMVF